MLACDALEIVGVPRVEIVVDTTRARQGPGRSDDRNRAADAGETGVTG